MNILKVKNPKSQTLNPKQYQNPKFRILNVLDLIFGIYLRFRN